MGLQREAALLYYSVEGQMKWEFKKLRRKSATTDCNGKGLPLEAATVRWNRRQGRRDRENDRELEMGKCELEGARKLQKTGARRDCNWERFSLFFFGGEGKFNYGKKAVVTTRWLWGSGKNGYASDWVVVISREANGKEDGGRAA